MWQENGIILLVRNLCVRVDFAVSQPANLHLAVHIDKGALTGCRFYNCVTN